MLGFFMVIKEINSCEPRLKTALMSCQVFLGHENDGDMSLEFLSIYVSHREILSEALYSFKS